MLGFVDDGDRGAVEHVVVEIVCQHVDLDSTAGKHLRYVADRDRRGPGRDEVLLLEIGLDFGALGLGERPVENQHGADLHRREARAADLLADHDALEVGGEGLRLGADQLAVQILVDDAVLEDGRLHEEPALYAVCRRHDVVPLTVALDCQVALGPDCESEGLAVLIVPEDRAGA